MQFGRRRFMLTAAASASSVMAADVHDVGKKLRCGILGIDHSHGLDILRVLQQSPDFELVGVCEPDETVKKRFSEMPQTNAVRWISQEELFGDSSIQVIAIESGVPRLLELARAAVDAGKHVH